MRLKVFLVATVFMETLLQWTTVLTLSQSEFVSSKNNSPPPAPTLSTQFLGPTFTSNFPKKILAPNTRTTLVPCTVHAKPPATVQWFWYDEVQSHKDGGMTSEIYDDVNRNWLPVTQSTSAILDQLKNGSLLVSDFVEDSKQDKERLHVYRVVCKAWNSVGAIISPAVHIRPVVASQYQMYTIQLMDVFTPVGNTAVFHCNINPYFMPEFVEVVTWQEENRDVIVTPGGRYSLMDQGDLRNGKLQVRNVSVSDSYKKFRCLTRNILTGKERSSNPAHLIVIEASNSPPRMTDHVSSMSATGGATVEIPCVAIAIPVARYRWSKNGIPIRGGRSDDDDGDRTSGGSTRLVGGNLLIENVQVDDSGDYRCVAENYIGHQGTSVRLSVTAPLSVHIEPQLQTVDSGREAVLRCHVEGHPVENITWLKDGKVLMTSSYEGGAVTEGEGGSVLRVEKVKRSDAGMYQCVVAGGGNEIVHASAQVSLGAFPPFILKEIPSEYLDPGTRVSMACSAIGNPRPTITWSVDGELLPSGQHGDRISVGDYVGGDGEIISHVNVTGAKVQDGGRYECLAANEMGEAREVAMLSVYGIPHIKPMRNITALAGSELEVTCRVTGYPVKEIFWKKGAQLLPTNHRQATSSNGSLLVSRLNRHLDEGWYSCHVINPNDQGMERRFYVRVIDPPKIDPFNFPLRKQGDRVSVSCVMSSGDLPMTLEWRKDGDVIDPDLGVQVHQSGSYSSFLSIEYATPHHNGNYTCIVTNEGATTSHTSQLHINVPPTWVSEPEDTSISLSATATIHCQAFGDPEPKVVWRKSVGGIMSSYRDIDLDGEETRLTHLGNGTLVINSVAKEDQGFYLCHASNNIAPDLSKVVHLTVHVPATFKTHDSNVSVSSGETAVIECHSEGDLPTTLNWSSSNKGSPDWGLDPRYQVTFFPIDKGQGSRLTISHVTKEDSGFYVCTAKNNYGSDVTSIHLMVLQLPEAPFDLEVVAGVEWAEFRWKEGFHGNSDIVEYLVEICRQGDSWKNPVTSLEVEASSRSVKVEKLRAATAYKARVKARNKVGFGEPSEIVTFDTLEVEPSSPPLNVSAMAVGSQSILVTWQPVPRTHENGRLLGYSVGYRRVNSSSPYLYVTVTNDNQRRLDDLEKFSTYSVHIRAFNGKGAGPMSEDVLVMTLEDVPSHAPVNVTARSQSSETISVAWSPPPLHSLNGVITGYKVIYKYVRDDEDESDSMSETTEQLSITLRHLKMFTNYSVQVLARTKIGEGIASSPVYVTTLEDVPDPPEDMKVLVMNRSSLLVVWKKPRRVNGVLVRYFVNVTQLTTRKPENQIEVSPLVHSHLLTSLDPDVRHVIKVGASTRVGDGKTTKEVIISTFERAEAKIAGFSRTLHFQWHNTVSIDCLAGGIPEPIITWEKGGVVVGTRDDSGGISMTAPKNVNKHRQNHRNHNYHTDHNYHSDVGDKMEILRNGTLVIRDLKGHDADEYKCQARNTYGFDEVTTTLIVQAPPSPPILMVTSVTSNSIQVTWKTTNNGGSKIKGFRLFKKLELGDWSFVDLDASNRSRLMTDLLCGSGYSFYIQAFNRLGMGLPSEEVKARTEGSAPIIPPQSMILDELNSTSATLTLTTWESGGCPITSFDLSYQVADDTTWKTVQKAIPSNTTTFTVTLNPGTWYVMRVTAHNDAGSTECLLRFSTLPYLGGSTVAPQHLVRKLNDFSFFSMIQKIHVIVPAAVAVIVVIVVVSVAVALYCYRKKNLKEADKVNSGLEVAMVVDDDVTGDQNDNNEYENERREGKRRSKKEEQNLLKRGIPKETQSHAVIIESEREVFHVTPNLAGVGTDGDDDDDDDDNDHHNLQWYARIPRDGFPDGSELQTAKNSSDDLHRFKCPPSSQVIAPISPPGCTCNALDSGHSTMVTTSGRSSAGESYRMLEPYGHHNHHHRHPVPPRACVLSVERHNHPGTVQHHKERSSHEESLFQCHPRRHHQLQKVPPVSIHGHSRCGYSCHDCNDSGSLYNQLTCTCSPDDCGLAPVEFPGLGGNRISRESEISFPPPPSSDYLSQQSSGVQNTPTDSHVTSPASSDEYPSHLFHRRCDVMS